MGVASMRFARPMPGASTARTCAGSTSPAIEARSAGTRLSSTRVVLPEPDTPVTAVSLPRGMAISSGLTVWIAPVSRKTAPWSNSSSAAALVLVRTVRSPERKAPIRECGLRSTSSTVPCAMISPPAAPEPGPISTMWSAWRSTRTSWSTSTTELPSVSRSSTTPSRPSTLEGWSPIEGSSST